MSNSEKWVCYDQNNLLSCAFVMNPDLAMVIMLCQCKAYETWLCQGNYAENNDIFQTFFCCCENSLFLGLRPLTTSTVHRCASLLRLNVLEYEKFDPIFGPKSATNVISPKLYTYISLHILFSWFWSGSYNLLRA